MAKSSIKLYTPEDISEDIKHTNAFIRRDGNFYLAKGYTFLNPSHQIESSALEIIRALFQKGSKKEILEKLGHERNGYNYYYLRSILVHHFGFVSFARHEVYRSKKVYDYQDQFAQYHFKEVALPNGYIDYSAVPNPDFNKMEAKTEQINTLTSLFDLNNDGSILDYQRESSDLILERVKKRKDKWVNEWYI